jgi:hypothetical protein
MTETIPKAPPMNTSRVGFSTLASHDGAISPGWPSSTVVIVSEQDAASRSVTHAGEHAESLIGGLLS